MLSATCESEMSNMKKGASKKVAFENQINEGEYLAHSTQATRSD